ncbi:MAG: O-antigen ligase family protein [Candidatus Kerfeldbacteria bacterium]|nr:O-antigen ligase family protein [Candidatus Kerfeldbacteria bacterium]
MSRKLFLSTIAALTTVELVSWLSFGNGFLQRASFAVVIVVIFIASCYRLEYGIYAIVAELVVGSFGYILSFPIYSFNVSLRLGLFLVVLVAWLITAWRTHHWAYRTLTLWPWYVGIFTFLIIGVGLGWLNQHNLKDIFFDWNGYIFFGMIFPFSHVLKSRVTIERLCTVLVAGVTVLGVQSVLVLFLFSHQTTFGYYLPTIYQWIRDYRIGEITLQAHNFYRVFFQSHLYVIFALVLSLTRFFSKPSWWWWLVMAVTTNLLVLSYSRTFWLVTVVTLTMWLVALWYYRLVTVRQLPGRLALTVLAMGVGYMVLYGIVVVPLAGDRGSDISATELLTDRADNPVTEAAGSSRLALLGPLWHKVIEHPFIGSGFGATVTYTSKDPRVLATHPDGRYTTYAFEWGYLDIWLKLGVPGIVLFFGLLYSLIRQAHQVLRSTVHQLANNDRTTIITVALGTLALGGIHLLTPYLNHPLGIGWLIIASCVMQFYVNQAAQN